MTIPFSSPLPGTGESASLDGKALSRNAANEAARSPHALRRGAGDNGRGRGRAIAMPIARSPTADAAGADFAMRYGTGRPQTRAGPNRDAPPDPSMPFPERQDRDPALPGGAPAGHSGGKELDRAGGLWKTGR